MLVDEETFENAITSAEEWIAIEMSKRNGFFTYNELNVFVTKNSLPKYYLPLLEQFLIFVISIIIVYVVTVAIALALITTHPITTGSTNTHSVYNTEENARYDTGLTITSNNSTTVCGFNSKDELKFLARQFPVIQRNFDETITGKSNYTNNFDDKGEELKKDFTFKSILFDKFSYKQYCF